MRCFLFFLVMCSAFGCKEKSPTAGRQLSGSKEVVAENTTPSPQTVPVESRTLPPQVEKPEIQSIDQLAGYLRGHPEALEGPNMDLLFLRFPGAFDDDRIVGMLRDFYLKKRSQGELWMRGVHWLSAARDKAIARVFVEDARKIVGIDFSNLSANSSIKEVPYLLSRSDKYTLLQGVFKIDDSASLQDLWSYFEEGNVNVQLLIAHALNSSENPARAKECISRLDSVLDNSVRGEMQDAINRIMYHLLDRNDVAPAQKSEALEVAAQLKVKGLARDFLLKKLAEAKN